jgi:hypothetical protein
MFARRTRDGCERHVREYAPYISKPARYITAALVVVTLGLEICAYLAYRDSVDGQAVLVNFAILIYAFIAAGVVFGIDEVARHLSRRRRSV